MQLTDRDNKDFWLFYIAYAFCWASDDIAEIMLSDYILENYELPSEDWFDQLTGGEEEPWQGTTLGLKLNESVSLFIEFHNDATIYFLNDTYIGEQSGHSFLSVFQWKEVKEITKGKDYSALLMLPLTVANKEEEGEIKEYLQNILKAFPFIKDRDIDYITKCLLSHIVCDEPAFSYDDDYGIICTRNHSLRNPNSNNNTLEEIRNLNNLIELAMQK